MKTAIVALHPLKATGMDAWLDHGVGVTYTAVKQAGLDIDFIDMKILNNAKELAESLKGYDLIAFGLKSAYYSIGMLLVEIAKMHGSKVIIGGYHATAAPDELLENPDIHWVMKGESEITFPEFLKNPDAFPKYFTGEKPEDLDALPFMDRSVYRDPLEPVGGWWPGHDRMTSVMTSRGCPYQCGFCQPLERNHFGRKVRRRSVDRTIEEMLYLKEKYNPDCMMIHDDTFLISSSWIEEFIEKYPQVGLPFWASGRADGICRHPDLVEKLIGVGWELVSIGFESGSQRILDIMKKGTTVEQNIEAAKIVHSHGAKIFANYMVGLPWETQEDIDATFNMARTINAALPSWAFFSPYPGCELGEKCINAGLSLLERTDYNRNAPDKKVKGVNYDYIVEELTGLYARG